MQTIIIDPTRPETIENFLKNVQQDKSASLQDKDEDRK